MSPSTLLVRPPTPAPANPSLPPRRCAPVSAAAATLRTSPAASPVAQFSRLRTKCRFAAPGVREDYSSTPIDVVADVKTEKVMACPFCRAPGGPCAAVDSGSPVFTVVLDRRCARRVYVPCSVRSHLARYIEECRDLAIQRGDTDIDLALHNSEGNLYHVIFTHGRMSSKFHGPSWEELVNNYGLRHSDMMTVMLEHYGTYISVEFHRDGVMLFPLPHVALEDLSETQRELVDSCFYSRGVTLNYHQMYVMSQQLFDDNYILCTPFVHRMDRMNVISQHMVIPTMVVRSLMEFVAIPRTGSLLLEITLDSEDDDIFVNIPCSYFIGLGNRMVLKKEGFENFLLASSIEVNNLVLITFKQREQELAVVFSYLPQ